MSYQIALLPDVAPNKPQTLTREEEYEQYIHSARWKQLRAKALQRANGKCEKCGTSKWSVTLEVHHQTYARFQNESLDDLVVLCPPCHKEADKERPHTAWMYGNNFDPWQTKIENWAKWKFGNDWRSIMDWNEVVKQYLAWRASGVL